MYNVQQMRYLKDVHKAVRLVTKQYHSTTSKRIKTDVQEIKIPVPWGHISGKWWGNPDVQPVLALHGVQDNAATFDRLIPLLQVDAVLALDTPGHGCSSHLPQGVPYDFTDAICFVRFVIHHYYKWVKPLVFLGHSFGSFLSFTYATLYPDEVSKYISIDCSRHLLIIYPDQTISTLRYAIDKTLSLQKKSKAPEYTKDELFDLFYNGRKQRVTKEGCKILLSRGVTTLENGKVYLSRDVRTKFFPAGRFTVDTLLTLAPRMKCDILSIQAEHGVVKNDEKAEIYRKTLESMIKNSAKSKHVIMKGNHHLHLEDPEPVAHEINKFLST